MLQHHYTSKLQKTNSMFTASPPFSFLVLLTLIWKHQRMDLGPCVSSRLPRFSPPSCLGVKSASGFFLLPRSPHCWQWVACGATLQPHHSDRGNSGIPSMLRIVLSSADVTAALPFAASRAQWQQCCVGHIWLGEGDARREVGDTAEVPVQMTHFLKLDSI